MDKARTIFATLIGGGAVVAALWVVYGLLGTSASEATVPRRAERPIPVLIEPVALEAQRLELDAVGTSRAVRSVTLFVEAAGEVELVAFEAGQRVAAGDLLLALEVRDEELALELAELRIADAERVLRRYDRARGTDAVPITDIEAAETALAAARIERDRAQIALDDRFLRAPFDGVVGLTDVQVGDRIDPTTAVTTLDDRSALMVRFELPELMLSAVQPGAPVAVSTWSGPEASAAGVVADVGSRIDPETRTIVARARVDNPDDMLRPGMSFRVKLRIEGRRYPVVPEIALQWGASGAYIWAVRDGRATRVDADVIQRLEGRVLLDAPLSPGDAIVTEGVQSMRAGRAVREAPNA